MTSHELDPDHPGLWRVADAADRLLERAARVPNPHRNALCARLALRSVLLRDWLRWTKSFPLACCVSLLVMLVGLLAILGRMPAVLCFALVLLGMVLLGAWAIRLWRVGWQALDIAVGAYLHWTRHERRD